jgi:hypothetical protein
MFHYLSAIIFETNYSENMKAIIIQKYNFKQSFLKYILNFTIRITRILQKNKKC